MHLLDLFANITQTSSRNNIIEDTLPTANSFKQFKNRISRHSGITDDMRGMLYIINIHMPDQWRKMK